MPVTAKLSRKVYDRLGDDVVNAIVDWFNQVDATYRGDLREMNELNFARFEAKVGERIAELETRIEKRFAELEIRIERRFADMEVRLARRIYITSAASFVAQIAALIALFKFFGR